MNAPNTTPTKYSPLWNPNHHTITQDYIVTSPLTPAENHAAYIASLNSTNTNFSISNIKKITELQIDQWYKVNSFIGKTNRYGKKYITVKLVDHFTNPVGGFAGDGIEVFLPDRFSNTIDPLDAREVHNT